MNKVVSCLYSFFKKHFLDYWYDVFTNRVVKFWSDILRRPSLNFLVFQFVNILWFCFLFSISHTVITDLPDYIKESPARITRIPSLISYIIDSIEINYLGALILFLSVPTTITLIEYLIKKNKLSNSQLFNKKEFIINTIIYILFHPFFIYIFNDMSNGGGLYLAIMGPIVTSLILPLTILLPFFVIFIVEQIKSARYAAIPYVKSTVNIYKLIPVAIIIYTLLVVLFAALLWLVIPIYMR